MNEMPRARFKESHKPVNRDRRYEVDQITDGAASPKTVIPQEYWDDMDDRIKAHFEEGYMFFLDSIPPLPTEAPF